MAMLKTYRIVTLTTSVAHNFVTGTTASSTGPYGHEHVGRAVIVQNQSTGATNIWVGGPSVVVGAAAASTSTGPFGIQVAQNASFDLSANDTRAINAHELWVVSTSSNAICVALLAKL